MAPWRRDPLHRPVPDSWPHGRPGSGRLTALPDDEKADVLREGIEDYLGEVDAEDLDADDLAWTLVNALRRAEAAKSPA
ncbi:hypothetical protein AB0G95_38250 [Streptomyces virginiae]|uniref:hypothetical protein n=1 Tax=Streptomyces virginiae TaxID=1961 RepID=UPI003446EFE2